VWFFQIKKSIGRVQVKTKSCFDYDDASQVIREWTRIHANRFFLISIRVHWRSLAVFVRKS
jgi:hypothetical protein